MENQTFRKRCHWNGRCSDARDCCGWHSGFRAHFVDVIDTSLIVGVECSYVLFCEVNTLQPLEGALLCRDR